MKKYFYSYVITPGVGPTTFHEFGNGIYVTDDSFNPLSFQAELNKKAPRRRTPYDKVSNPDSLPVITGKDASLTILYYSELSE